MERNKLIKVIFIFSIVALGFFLIKAIFYRKEDKTKIVFFGLEKADSIYIENASKKMLIDAGLKSQRESIIEKLESLAVKKLDYLVLTHGDKDHIGSASYILDRFEIGEVIQSHNIKDTKRQANIKKVLEEKNIKSISPSKDINFDLGDLKVTIFTPKKDYYEKDNDYSLVTLIKDGDLNYLFAGDAEEELLKESLDLDLPPIDLYKVPHHGRENPNSQKMINKISPQYSVITNITGEGEVDDFLKEAGSKIIYTSGKDIEFISDGNSLK